MSELASRLEALAARSAARRAAAREQEEREAAREQEEREAAEREQAIESKRSAMREAMPKTAALVDSVRAVFGEVTVLAAVEGDRRVVNSRACRRANIDGGAYVGE